jgi:hypothetical protein
MSDTPVSSWRTPFILIGLGLLLMVGGYQLMSYRALSPRQAEQQRRLEDLRQQAQVQAETEADKKALADRLDNIAVPAATPYRPMGQFAIYVGLMLFVAAFLIMYRSRPQREQDAVSEGEDFGEEAPVER